MDEMELKLMWIIRHKELVEPEHYERLLEELDRCIADIDAAVD